MTTNRTALLSDSESDIKLDIKTDDQATNKTDAFCLPYNLVSIIVDYSDFTEVSMLAHFPEGRQLLQIYTGSEQKVEEMKSASLPPFASTLSKILNKIIDIELQRLRRNNIIKVYLKKGAAFLGTTIGIGTAGYLVYYGIQKGIEEKDFLKEYQETGNIIYNQIEQVCTNVYSFLNNTCTIIPNVFCPTNATISCSTYDLYFLNCGKGDDDDWWKPTATQLPINNPPCTTPLFDRLVNCSGELLSNYTDICSQAWNSVNRSADLVAGGVIGGLASAAIGVCSYFKIGDVGEYDRETVLKSPFSTLPTLPKNTENYAIYEDIINKLKAPNITVGDMLQRIKNLSLRISNENQLTCNFYKKAPKNLPTIKEESKIHLLNKH